MNYYDAKFAREAKERPVDWIIIPTGYMRYRLVNIGAPREYDAPVATIGRTTSVPHLRVVK